MSTPARFSDGQYKNWLKCSQSLIIMKEALHDYIDNEVKKVHGDITLKVSSIPCASSTGNQCGSCSSKDIKLTGKKPRTWYINCKNSICDKWLQQILAFHEEPNNTNINWKNTDISKWPTDCYHVAKVFMPKGQDKTTKMPDDLDAPAILSLMKYCSWFRTDLPNTQILSDLIEIRNKVLHSGVLKVADSDKDRWIDLMTQLLIDLKIPGGAQNELQTLKREYIDIKFREIEISVFRTMVTNLSGELATVKGDMVSLQDSQNKLCKEMNRLGDKSTETTIKMDSVETDVKEMCKCLDEIKNISDKMASFFNKNPDILDVKITETIKSIGIDVEDQQKNLFRVETELKAGLSALKMQMEKHQEETKKQFEGVERRFAALPKQKEEDEQLSLYNLEAPRKRRPESDYLKQLKNQTEDKLDTLRRLECIPTKQAEKAKKFFENKRSIVIKGNPGEGKTTTALHLIDNEMYRDRRVMLNYPQDWRAVDTDWVDIVIMDDIFGQFDLDSDHLQEWMVYLPTVQEHVDAGKLQVIITTRDDILSKAYSKLGSLKLFSGDFLLTLSSEQLTNSEKISILNRELRRHKKSMKEDEKRCISNYSGLIGFPQCCLLFAGESKSFDRGIEFFRSPEKFFVANITELKATRFLSLAFLFCIDKIFEEELSPEAMSGSSKCILMELASCLNYSGKEVSITLLRDAYDSFMELYVVKSMSFVRSSKLLVKKSCIKFAHATVCEAVGHVLADRCPEMVVKYASSEYLYQRTYTAKVKDDACQNVFLPVCVYRLLAERMVNDVVKGGLVGSVVQHSALKQTDFVMILKDELQKGNWINAFAKTDTTLYDHNLLEGNCNTFMQHILKCDADVVRLVYSQLLELLTCAHNNNCSYCWQCKEKQELLELSLYYHHFEIADKLVIMKACYTHVSLCNAAKHDNLRRVQIILETLKSNEVFDPECKTSVDALWIAYRSGNQKLIAYLLTEGITLDSMHVVDAVNHGDMNLLMSVVEHLKCHNKWKPDREEHIDYLPFAKFMYIASQSDIPYSKALYIAYNNKKFDMAEYLQKNEVKVSMCMLAVIVGYGSKKAVARMIQNLKDTDSWRPKCDDASEALAQAYSYNKIDICDLLIQEGISLTMKNFPKVTHCFMKLSLGSVKKAIQHLKDTDNWNPKCDDASKALENAYEYSDQNYDVCDLLIHEGVSLTMKNLHEMTIVCDKSLESIKKAIQHLKDTDNWNPKCADASKALENAYKYSDQNYDVCDLLVHEGVSPTMKNLPQFTFACNKSLEFIKKAIQHLKDTDNWNPKCADASKKLANAYKYSDQNYDVCDLLIHEGVSLTMKNLPEMTIVCDKSLESIKKAIQHLKDTDNWNPKCADASKALENAYKYSDQNYDVCDLLVHEGVSLTMKNLPEMTIVCDKSLESIKKAIQHLKDTDNWNPKCADASKALENAYKYSDQNYDVCDLLIHEGVSLTMKNLPELTFGCNKSLESIKKAIQHLKDTDNWNPKCADASDALEYVDFIKNYALHDLLVQEGVSVRKLCIIL